MTAEHVDVIVVGAGLSGVGAACHLARECPDRTVLVLEGRDAIGGTWDLFRYPGIRSDSDMFTLGYDFRPWTHPKAIADGPSILAYIHDTVRDGGVEDRIRLGHRVIGAEWDSATALWTVQVEHADERRTFTCSLLWSCCGYYRYDHGHQPDIPGVADFAGPVVHPQLWPDDLDHAGKRVVVIGSGATAVTLVPAMAATAEHVTMLQRSPSYVASRASSDRLADVLRKRLPAASAYAVVRWKNALGAIAGFELSRRRPAVVRKALLRAAAKALPAGYDLATHFTPRYDPWDQRMCLIPDGDLFAAISSGRADVVTDRIERITPTGVRLESGTDIEADVIVTATGLEMLAVGGMQLSVDGRPVEVGESVIYKGVMLSDVPNFAWTFGYTNSSWTLKADLIARYVCRLLNHMGAHGYASVTPERPADGGVLPMLDLTSGYVRRGAAQMPRQGSGAPWQLHQNWMRDRKLLRGGPIHDGVRFARAPAPARESVRS